MVDLNGTFAFPATEMPAFSKPLAMAFVNKQPAPDTMSVPSAFVKGTLFGSLYMPFTAGGNVG